MSKTDDLRAMREARYAANQARGAAARQAPKAPRRADPGPAPAPAPADGVAVPGPPGDRLCGHRAISGRTCTREHGHAAKSHRYS